MPSGTSTRRGKKQIQEKSNGTVEGSMNGAYQVPEGRELKITYPNKKHHVSKLINY